MTFLNLLWQAAIPRRLIRSYPYARCLGQVVARAPLACGCIHTTEQATYTPDQRLGVEWVSGSARPCGVAWDAVPKQSWCNKAAASQTQMQTHTRSRKRTRVRLCCRHLPNACPSTASCALTHSRTDAHEWTQRHMYAHAHKHTHTNAHVHIRTQTHAVREQAHEYARTHIHTHTQTSKRTRTLPGPVTALRPSPRV